MRDFERQESMYMHQGKTVFSLRINYSPHVEIPRYLEIPVTDFCETSQIRPIIRLRALVTSLHMRGPKVKLCPQKILGPATLRKPTGIWPCNVFV